MIHHNTKNLYFLKMFYILEELGIKNSTFFLELKDSSLQNIDPHSENLSQEVKLRIINEIAINPWYFFREVVRIPITGEKERFELHRGNTAMLYMMINSINISVLLPRQCYKSWTVCIFYVWAFYFGTKDNKILFFSYSDSHVLKNIRTFKDIRECLPSYLQFQLPAKDKDNVKEITFAPLKNMIQKQAPSTSKEAADKMGRGFTSPMQYYDEPAHAPNIGITYTSATLAYATVARYAKKNNKMYGKVMTTTAGYLNQDSGRWTKHFYDSSADFHEALYDLSIDRLREYIRQNSTNDFLRIEFMYYDLGKDENYYKEMLIEVNYDMDKVSREIKNIWLDATKDHPLGQNRLVKLSSKKRSPSDTILINNIFFLNLYIPIDKLDLNKKFVGGLDCGGNLRRDFSALTIIDPTNGEVIGVMRANTHSTILFSNAVAEIMTLFKNMILVPERNNMGIVIIDNILDNNPSFIMRVYHDETGKSGLYTDAKIRAIIYGDLLRVVVDEYGDKIKDNHIISEIETLERKRNGRIDHQNGAHDDTLLSLLFAFWFIIYCKLKERYIDPAIILTDKINSDKGDIPMMKITDTNKKILDKIENQETTKDNKLMDMWDKYNTTASKSKKQGSIRIVDKDNKNINIDNDDMDKPSNIDDIKTNDMESILSGSLNTDLKESPEAIDLKNILY